MEKIKILINGKEGSVYSIHYSCSGFYNNGAIAPMICAIALCSLKTNEIHSFNIQNYLMQNKCLIDAERQLLQDFVIFYNGIKNPIFVHWNMDEIEYGFKAINARCENFGIQNFSFTKLKTINFSDYIFLSLKRALKFVNCLSPDFMDGRAEAIAFDKRNYSAVKLSTEAKAYGLIQLLSRLLKKEVEFSDFDDDSIVD